MSHAISEALTSDVCEAIDTILSMYAIDTVPADTETGLVNGFAWLIYFNVVKTEQPETDTEAQDRDWDLKFQDWDRDSSFWAETETLKFESLDVSRSRRLDVRRLVTETQVSRTTSLVYVCCIYYRPNVLSLFRSGVNGLDSWS